MSTSLWRRAIQVAVIGLLALGALSITRADDDDDEHGHQRVSRTTAAPMLPLYQQECAACHLAYPAGMLPAASWQRLMSNLPKHFGTDASLEPAQVQAISRWLTDHAATRAKRAAPPPEDRITRAAWFVHEHDEIAAATWKRASIKSPSNCIACHTRADQGDFNERFIRIPR